MRQDAQITEQPGVVMARPQAQAIDLLLKLHARFDSRQRQVAHGASALHFAHLIALDYTDAAFAVWQFELN